MAERKITILTRKVFSVYSETLERFSKFLINRNFPISRHCERKVADRLAKLKFNYMDRRAALRLAMMCGEVNVIPRFYVLVS
jgi:hypothetical protein